MEENTTKRRSNKKHVANDLQYFVGSIANTILLQLIVVRRLYCIDEHEYATTTSMRNLFGGMRWAAVEDDHCTTWLELYIIYRLHGGKQCVRSRSFLDKPITLGEEVAVFLKGCTKIQDLQLEEGGRVDPRSQPGPSEQAPATWHNEYACIG